MKPSYRIWVVPHSDVYTPEQVHDLLLAAQAQGHPLGAGSYLEAMTLTQLDGVVYGRFDA